MIRGSWHARTASGGRGLYCATYDCCNGWSTPVTEQKMAKAFKQLFMAGAPTKPVKSKWTKVGQPPALCQQPANTLLSAKLSEGTICVVC